VSDFPIQPDEATLEELLDLARRLMEHPENRPGADKSWVLDRLRRFQAIVRAPRVRLERPLPPPPPRADSTRPAT